MKTSLLAALACSLCTLCATAALAQQEPDTDAFNGKWQLSLQAGGRPVARLTLQNFAGFWQDTGTATLMKAKPCKGKRFPITVQASVQTGLEFTAWGSAVSPACPDISVSVKPVNDKALAGWLESALKNTPTVGEDIRMSRP